MLMQAPHTATESTHAKADKVGINIVEGICILEINIQMPSLQFTAKGINPERQS
jgi:hypothetical protein